MNDDSSKKIMLTSHGPITLRFPFPPIDIPTEQSMRSTQDHFNRGLDWDTRCLAFQPPSIAERAPAWPGGLRMGLPHPIFAKIAHLLGDQPSPKLSCAHRVSFQIIQHWQAPIGPTFQLCANAAILNSGA